MNRRAALRARARRRAAADAHRALYAFEVVFHKLLRRFVGFFLLALLASSVGAGGRPTRSGGSCSRLSSPSTRSRRRAGCWRTRAGAASSRSGSPTSSAWPTGRRRWPCCPCWRACASSAGSPWACAARPAARRGADAGGTRPMALPTSTRRRLTRVAESGARRVLPPPDPGRAPGRALLPLGRPVAELPVAHAPTCSTSTSPGCEDHCQVVALDELVAGPGPTRRPVRGHHLRRRLRRQPHARPAAAGGARA